MNDERDSQLSAMFDNELPGTECELLARRLSRDDNLQRQWASYSLIGAALRGEPVRARTLSSVVRDGKGQVAERVRAVLHEDAILAVSARAVALREQRGMASSWLRPLAGAGIAAGVAALSIFMLRQQTAVQTAAAVPTTVTVSVPRSTTTIVLPGRSLQRSQAVVAARISGELESYTVPVTRANGLGIASAQLANYVVAHSEYSGPLARRNLLAALVASETQPPASDAGVANKPGFANNDPAAIGQTPAVESSGAPLAPAPAGLAPVGQSPLSPPAVRPPARALGLQP